MGVKSTTDRAIRFDGDLDANRLPSLRKRWKTKQKPEKENERKPLT